MATNNIKIKFTDCSTYPNVTDANFDKDCNGNVVITCRKGFKMVQELECVEEEWRYQNPICKRTECSYKYLNKTCLASSNTDYYDYTSTEDDLCDEECKSFTRWCTASLNSGNYCNLYKAPIIFGSFDTDLNQCIEKCKERSDCVTMSSSTVANKKCFLFNVTVTAESSISFVELHFCVLKITCLYMA
ncbi:hypothetical protein LOTGIDRAFT_175908 [Lottia gigantea]|uniref:Uncharacterized protein n=1 Tax=Lottia gigantea TaxID=225164 RepID=V3ZZJ4_LOTGI|nr:hypothetical protein LOTGIDRAFT_175908 [Lottia gigantea]ESO88085.1 hypothetical protein LOTGIDRAFT_175908 [Lottia gigantea]